MPVTKNLIELRNSLPAGVTLVAVSKTKPNDMILEAYGTGQRDFGENYVQELVDKYEQLPKDIHWHFIGHLQSNKIKYLAPFVHLIHGIDSLKLLREIDKQAAKHNRVISCLLQVYIAREESKFGFDPEEVRELLRSGVTGALKHIHITGLMGMASNTDHEKQISSEFKILSALFNELKNMPVPGVSMQHLSCGMSSDYKLALAAGSNMLRIGSTIFGERNYIN
jgi:pyridoxal phosphate enzyme (YggS family)